MKERVVKLATMGLSAAMVMGTAVPVLAANNEITDTRTFTISAKTDDTHSIKEITVFKYCGGYLHEPINRKEAAG